MVGGVAIASHALTFEEAFQASDSQVLWLIVLSFFLAKVGAGFRVAVLCMC